MEKVIHIHAKCPAFEIFEQVPEKRAVKRLETIKAMYESRSSRLVGSRLVVKTILANPEFLFR